MEWDITESAPQMTPTILLLPELQIVEAGEGVGARHQAGLTVSTPVVRAFHVGSKCPMTKMPFPGYPHRG